MSERGQESSGLSLRVRLNLIQNKQLELEAQPAALGALSSPSVLTFILDLEISASEKKKENQHMIIHCERKYF